MADVQQRQRHAACALLVERTYEAGFALLTPKLAHDLCELAASSSFDGLCRSIRVVTRITRQSGSTGGLSALAAVAEGPRKSWTASVSATSQDGARRLAGHSRSPVDPQRSAGMSSSDRVSRRHVLHITGYDGRPPEATLAFFRRELETWARRFGASAAVTAEPDLTTPAPTWRVDFAGEGGGVSLVWTLLRWDDLVRQDRHRGFLVRTAVALATLTHVVRTGTLGRWRRASPLLARVFLAPYGVCALVPTVGLVAVAWAFALGASVALALFVGGLASGAIVLSLTRVSGERLFGLQPMPVPATIGRLGQLFDLWAFIRAHAEQPSPALAARIAGFADAIATARQGRTVDAEVPSDEVVLIGHSLGAVLALEALDRTSRVCEGSPLVLLTVGALHEALAHLPEGERVRELMRRVAARRDVVWIDVADDQDPLAFPKGDGPERLGVVRGPAGQPIFVDPNFGATLATETLRFSRLRIFRMHYRYLMASEGAGGWDVFALLGGVRHVPDELALAGLRLSNPP